MNPPPENNDFLGRGFKGLCPRCGKASIFKDFLAFKARCPACGLDLTSHDNGDGPIFFAIVVVSFVVTTLAALTEYFWSPPFWLHALLWTPLVILMSLVLLRVFKGILLASQVKHQLLGHEE